MAGIYLHIPFCRKACSYCDFHFSTNLSRKAELVEAILVEADLRHAFFGEGQAAGSLYFGGGTPSLLSDAELGALIRGIREKFSISPEAEITLEANPDDLDADRLDRLRSLGINRLSLGIQSFREQDLQLMNRSHSAAQAQALLADLVRAGFANYSVDLIFGIPGLDAHAWESNLLQVVEARVPHLSLYALTVEQKTALAWQVKKGEIRMPAEETFESQFLQAHELLIAAGYEHYELSNYALPGHRSRHNSAYWSGAAYLGLGPSAHSFDGDVRSWNFANNQKYLQSLNAGQLAIADTESLSPTDRLNEYIMTRLRTMEGIDLSRIREMAPTWEEETAARLADYEERSLLLRDQGHLKMNPAHWMLSDAVIADLFME